MFASFLLAATVFFGGPRAGAADSALVGTWGLDGRPFLVFKADGSGTMEGESFTWTADAKVIHVKSAQGEQDQMSYTVQDGQLALVAGGIPMALTRLGAKAAAKGKADDPAADPPSAKGKAAKEKVAAADPPASSGSGKIDVSSSLAKLLLSSPWCTFHYNQTSGASSSSRVVFHPDGTWERGRQGETYSSGYGGTYAGQSNSGDAGKWKVENNLLYMSSAETRGELQPLQLFVKKNSNGYPIINSNGDEYSQCK